MKKIFSVFLIVILTVMFSGCADSKYIYLEKNGQTEPVSTLIEPYGLFNDETKCEEVQYRVSVGNVVWGCILIETIVAPVVIVGWYLYEPVCPK